MIVSPSVRRIVFELAEHAAANNIDPAGVIDKDGQLEEVMERLDGDHPELARLAREDAYYGLMRGLLSEWCRHSMSSVAEQDREMLGIVKIAHRQRQYLEIPRGGNLYERKRRLDCTRKDLEDFVSHRTKLLNAQRREVDWAQDTVDEMIRRNLPESATVRDVLESAA